MKEYNTNNIRNIAILGHLGSGKTTLSESLLYMSKTIEKKGEVEKKNTVSDFYPEEQSRLSSVSTSVIPIEWKDTKLNYLDIPGSEEFIAELNNALEVCKGAILVIDASKGIEVGTERAWNELRKKNIPTFIYLNKMDKENIKFENVLNDLRTKFSKKIIPFSYPLGKNENFDGFVNVVLNKARIFDGEKCNDQEVWPDKQEIINNLRNELLEVVAGTSEDLLDKFIGGEELTLEEVNNGLKTGVINGDIFPILVGSALKNIGIETLMTMSIDYLPKPNDLKPIKGLDENNKEILRKTLDEEPFSAYVFKTTVDPFLGIINYIKINSGVLTLGLEVLNTKEGKIEKINNLFIPRGKQQLSINKVYAGDICCISKLNSVKTGDTLSDKKNIITYKSAYIPSPTIYVAIVPRKKEDEDKISQALQKLGLEDQSFEIKRNKETYQLLIGGQGMMHIGYILERMKNMFKVDVETADPKIVYRETIKKKAAAEGKYIKQSGGAGQYGIVQIEYEPSDKPFEFAERIFGGSVPKNFHPAVEKGLVEALESGPLAGFPVINIKCTLYDGKYHEVDSSEQSFKMAAVMSFRKASEENKFQAIILEPIYKICVTIKEDYVGDIMGDITKRRGRVLGMSANGNYQTIEAEVPESEIIKYTIDLKAMTQGSGYFTREFLRYDEVPANLVPKIVQENKREERK